MQLRQLVEAEFVTNAFYCGDKIVTDFLTDFADMNIDRAGQHINIGPPNVLQQVLATEHLVGILREKIEQFKFLFWETDFQTQKTPRL